MAQDWEGRRNRAKSIDRPGQQTQHAAPPGELAGEEKKEPG